MSLGKSPGLQEPQCPPGSSRGGHVPVAGSRERARDLVWEQGSHSAPPVLGKDSVTRGPITRQPYPPPRAQGRGSHSCAPLQVMTPSKSSPCMGTGLARPMPAAMAGVPSLHPHCHAMCVPASCWEPALYNEGAGAQTSQLLRVAWACGEQMGHGRKQGPCEGAGRRGCLRRSGVPHPDTLCCSGFNLVLGL